MIIHNLNPTDEIGASAWHLNDSDFSILLDAGLHPKLDGKSSIPSFERIGSQHLDVVAISHCHYDHVAGLPIALKKFPEARVLMTELSSHVVERVLHNSANVMKRQRDEMGILDYPLYDNQNVEEISNVFEGVPYEEKHVCHYASSSNPNGSKFNPSIEFINAGHTLGAAGILVESKNHRTFYTGDCSFQDQFLLKGARFENIQADTVILETTRGSADTTKTSDRNGEIRKLKESILEVVKRNGCVLIPSFALGRTQEVLALISSLIRDGLIPKQPIYVGGLGRIFSEIYDGTSRKTERAFPDLKLCKELNLVVLKMDKIHSMPLRKSKIFVVTAGMMNQNTASYELALRLSQDPIHGIFFVGYADPSTPGGALKNSQSGKPFAFTAKDHDVVRNCELKSFDLTGHANREELLDWVMKVRPKNIILAHGDPESRDWFHEHISHQNSNINIYNPGPGEEVLIED